jgi:carbon-monoxide dehydrogenase medium subunit
MTKGGYVAPRTLEDAVALLARTPGGRVLAGGHRLLVEPTRSQLGPAVLVDLGKIESLAGIERRGDGSLKIGAMTTLGTLTTSDAIRNIWPALSDSARAGADAQTRNRATIGGSVAGGDPEADVPPVLLALDATIEVTGSSGTRSLALKDLYTVTGQTSLRSDDVITAVVVPPRGDRSAAAYERFGHPATLGAICGVAALVTVGGNGAITDARVALAGAVNRTVVVAAAGKALAGQQPTGAVLDSAAATTKDAGTFFDDHFASAEYRRHLAHVLTVRALKRAVKEAEAAGQS